ncbi:MAG: FlgD immunoglobulin-like domain containing protein [bacterium]
MRAILRFTIPLLVLIAAAVLLTIVSEQKSNPGLADLVGKRPGQVPNDWFHAQRAFPNVAIPAGAYERAVAQALALAGLPARDPAAADPAAPLRAVTQREATGPDFAHDGGGAEASAVPAAWNAIGPTNVGGRITAVASHPTSPSTVFIGGAEGGVWKTTDGAVTWTPIFDGIGSQSIGSVVVAPQDANTIWVGTGEANGSGDSYDGDGVYMSPNGGETWYARGLAETRRIGRVALDPTDDQRIYVAAAGALFTKDGNRGIYRSTDAGYTWEHTLFVSDSTSGIDVVVEPGNPANVYAATWERLRRPFARKVGGFTSGIYKSTDFGATWALLGSGLPAPAANVGRIGLSASVSAPGTLVAIYADDPGNFLGLFRTTNSGASWTAVNSGSLSGMYSGFGWYFGQVRIDPTNVNRIFALGVPMYRTTNGGTSWTSVGGSMHVDHHDIWIDPSLNTRIWAGNDGGFYRSTNGGGAWTFMPGLPLTQFYAITVDAQNANRRYGGTQDNGTNRTTTGGSGDWSNIYGGDGFYCLVNPTNSSVIYAESQFGGLGKSINDAGSFSSATNGIAGGERANWSTPVVMDATNPDVLYYGTQRVWRTSNAASNWNAISPDLTDGPSPGNLTFGTVTTIAVAPTDTATIYAGTDDGNVWVTQSLGLNWTKVSTTLPKRWVTRVAVDPQSDAIAYVTHSGYREDAFLPHVYRTTDFGATWSDISGNLPEAPVNSLVIDPVNPATLFVGTDVGVYMTYDLGAVWSPVSYGLPPVVVSDIHFHAATRTLYAGTHGRSMYAVAIPASPTGVEPAAGAGVIASLELGAPAPNPSRDAVRVGLALARDARVDAAVHDASGRRVRQLAARDLARGAHTLAWDRADDSGTRVAAGVYFLRVEAGALVATRKITLVD